MTLVWPVTLPQAFSRDSYDEALPDNVIADGVDVGPAILRQQTLSNTAPLAGSMVMTSGQWDDLKTFFMTTTKQVLPFTFPCIDGGTITVRFKQGAPPRRQVWTSAGKFRVTLSFEIMP